MWVANFVKDLDVVQAEVEELVDAFEGALDCQIILELNGDALSRERLERREHQLVSHSSHHAVKEWLRERASL